LIIGNPVGVTFYFFTQENYLIVIKKSRKKSGSFY